MTYKQVCDKWDNWLDDFIERNLYRIIVVFCLIVGLSFLTWLYVCLSTVQAVARLSQEAVKTETQYIHLRDEITRLKTNRSAKSDDVSRSYQRTRTETFNVSAYSLAEKECGKPVNHPLYGVTASGRKLTNSDAYKIVAVDNTKIKFGTRMVIHSPAGPIPVVAADTGGAIKGNKLDLFVGDENAAWGWGIKRLKVTVYE